MLCRCFANLKGAASRKSGAVVAVSAAKKTAKVAAPKLAVKPTPKRTPRGPAKTSELAKVAATRAALKAAEASNAVPWWFAPLKERHLVTVVDGHAMLYRCFHVYERLTPKDRQSETAMDRWVADSVKNYITGLRRLRPPKAPEDVHYHEQTIVTLDGGAYARAEALPSYKSNRDVLRRPEIDYFVKKAMITLRTMPGISVVPAKLGDFAAEADDIIYTVIEKVKEVGNAEAIVASHDKDLFQLIDSSRGMHYYNLGSKQFLNEADVLKKVGVLPWQIRDYLSLLGDVSDAIPGVAGLGKVRAAKLLQMHDTMENIFAKARAGTLTGVPKEVADGILPFEQQAFKMREHVVKLRHVPEVLAQISLNCEKVKQ